jgi:hypothetical protein
MLLEINAILAQVFGRKQIGGFIIVLRQMTDAGVIGLLRARTDGQKFKIIGEGF